jgi:hypothetical protein
VIVNQPVLNKSFNGVITTSYSLPSCILARLGYPRSAGKEILEDREVSRRPKHVNRVELSPKLPSFATLYLNLCLFAIYPRGDSSGTGSSLQLVDEAIPCGVRTTRTLQDSCLERRSFAGYMYELDEKVSMTW